MNDDISPQTSPPHCAACGAVLRGPRFCEQCGAAVPVIDSARPETLSAPRQTSRMLMIGLVIASIVIVGGAGAAVAVVGLSGGDDVATVDPETRATPSFERTSPALEEGEATETPAPSASPTPEPSPTVAVRAGLPASCESMYSDAMITEMESYDVVLNPAWAAQPGSTGNPVNDSELRRILDSLPQLRCFWGNPLGASGIGLETRVSAVLPEEGAAIERRLQEMGYDAIDELGSTRYVDAVSASEFSGAYGESHIVVGGYWFATLWIELGVTGYTADMVRNVVG